MPEGVVILDWEVSTQAGRCGSATQLRHVPTSSDRSRNGNISVGKRKENHLLLDFVQTLATIGENFFSPCDPARSRAERKTSCGKFKRSSPYQ